MKDTLRVDWSAYSPIQRIICRIPILNLFFTEKFDVSFFIIASSLCNCHSVDKRLRFPKSPKLGVYNVLTCINKDLVDAKYDTLHLCVTIWKDCEEVGSTIHPMRLGDQKKLNKYYVGKNSYKGKLNLL